MFWGFLELKQDKGRITGWLGADLAGDKCRFGRVHLLFSHAPTTPLFPRRLFLFKFVQIVSKSRSGFARALPRPCGVDVGVVYQIYRPGATF